MDQISYYSDLKALLLTSKELSDLAIPCLYKWVDLTTKPYDRFNERMSETDEDDQLSQKIESLLIEPANVRFVGGLRTGPFGIKSTQPMDRLLPLLPEDLMKDYMSTSARLVGLQQTVS